MAKCYEIILTIVFLVVWRPWNFITNQVRYILNTCISSTNWQSACGGSWWDLPYCLFNQLLCRHYSARLTQGTTFSLKRKSIDFQTNDKQHAQIIPYRFTAPIKPLFKPTSPPDWFTWTYNQNDPIAVVVEPVLRPGLPYHKSIALTRASMTFH